MAEDTDIMPVELLVNGKTHRVNVYADTPLLWVLRDELDLTGTKYGCGEGQCGACTVLVGGVPLRSCQMQVGNVAGKPITTIEGLAQDDHLTALQEAFLKEDAMQCAYCTSGFLLASTALLRSNPHPSVEQVAHSLQGNICRCGTHSRIIAAVRRAAEMGKGA